MSASSRILDNFVKSNGSEPIRILGASGQLGYGVPTPAFNAGLERAPHLIGCDMGSIDPGPYYLSAIRHGSRWAVPIAAISARTGAI
jgi:hypothetical protein